MTPSRKARGLVSKHQIRPNCGEERAGARRDGRTRLEIPNIRRERGRGNSFFSPDQLTTINSRIDVYARLFNTMLNVLDVLNAQITHLEQIIF